MVAVRIKEVRTRRGLTAAQLAIRCAGVGRPDLTASAISNIETGRRDNTGRRRRDVTVDELLALAKALQVSPVHLLVPPAADDEPYQVTPEVAAPALHVREWVRGYGLLPGDDRQVYLSEVPPGEFEEIEGLLFPTRQPWQLRQMRRTPKRSRSKGEKSTE